MKIIIFITLLFYSSLFSYQDYDIDGVEDNIDRCPNTPFDKLVDKFGCPEDKSYLGLLTLKIGSDISNDKDYEQINNLNFYLNYNYYQWDISISNANYQVLDTSSNNISDTKDLYISGGYLFKTDSIHTKLSVGSKISTSKVDDNTSLYIGTGEDDYFASINLNFFINDKQNLFLYYGYTLSGDTNSINYENTNSFSIGGGYAFTNKLYSAVSFEFVSSLYKEDDDYSAVSWFNSYSFSKEYFATLNYAYALNKLSYDHTLSIKIGVYFE